MHSRRLCIWIALFFISATGLAKNNFNDTLVAKLQGQGCGVRPTDQEISYNIAFLQKQLKEDSANVYAYKHLAMQYYILYARSTDNNIKEHYLKLAIENNLSILNRNTFGALIRRQAISNIVLLYALNNECIEAKKYYGLLGKKDIKALRNTGIEDAIRQACDANQ
jgi:hypothetical protein